MRLAVSADGYTSAVQSFVDASRVVADGGLRLSRRLDAHGGMAGNDSTAEEFAAAYDPAAAATLASLESAVGAVGALAHLVEATLANHAHAERQSVLPGWAQAVTGPPTRADRAVGLLLAPPPSALGPHESSPGGAAGLVWACLHDVFWPNADTDEVRAAGTAWRDAARCVGLLVVHCDAATRALEGELSPEVPLALDVVAEARRQAQALSDQMVALADACVDYAAAVDERRQQLVDLLHDVLVELGVGAAVSGALSFVTFGGAAAFGGSAGTARLATAARDVRDILEALGATIRISSSRLRATPALASDASSFFTRVRSARVMLMEGRGVSGAGARPAFESPTAWAERQTRAGGHMAEEHIGKSDRFLRRRLLSRRDIAGASTFPDSSTAHSAVHEVLARRHAEIESWLNGTGRALPLEEALESVTGRTMLRSGETSEVHGVFVKLVRDPIQPEGFYVRTAFPKKVTP